MEELESVQLGEDSGRSSSALLLNIPAKLRRRSPASGGKRQAPASTDRCSHPSGKSRAHVREEWTSARDDEEGFDGAGDVVSRSVALATLGCHGRLSDATLFPRTSGGCASLRCDCRVTPRCRTSHGGSSVRLGSAPREHESPATVGASARNLRPHKLRGRPSSHLFRVAVRATARRALATAHGVHDARAPKAHCPTPPPFQSLKGARGSQPACRARAAPWAAQPRPRRCCQSPASCG